MKRVLTLALLLVSSLALAAGCIYAGVAFPGEVGLGATNIRSADAWEKIAKAMEPYGDFAKDIEGQVNVTVRMFNGIRHVVPMPKMCGETMAQAAKRVAERARQMMGDTSEQAPGTVPDGGGYYYYYGTIGSGGHTGCIYGCDNLWGTVGGVTPVI